MLVLLYLFAACLHAGAVAGGRRWRPLGGTSYCVGTRHSREAVH